MATAETRRRILDAALATLKSDGFAGSSARAIARTGGFNQALIFYHYGSVVDLLLAALDETSRLRLQRYSSAVEEVRDLPSAVRRAAELFGEDMESGHITVLTELISGSSSVPDLGRRIRERLQPWLGFTEDEYERMTRGTPLLAMVPARQAAFAVVALYLGIEMLTHLDRDASMAEELFATADRLASWVHRGGSPEPAGG